MSGTYSKQLYFTAQYSSGRWGTTTGTFYLEYSSSWYSSGWEISQYSSSSLYFLTYTLFDNDDDDMETLVNIKILGGNVKNNVYGGANQNTIYGTVDIDMNNGTVNGTIYGGSNLKGEIQGSVLMDISGGQVGTQSNAATTDYTSIDAIFGGGLGSTTNIQGAVKLNITDESNNLNIYGNSYGGSSLGTVSGNVNVNIYDNKSSNNKINIIGYVFGGGKGNATTSAKVNGNATINVDGSDLGECSVFGGSNINGTINQTITVNVGKNYSSKLYAVYGGGNEAGITTTTQGVYVYLYDYANVTNAFNGGKSADLLSSGETDTTRAIYLNGGTVQNMYGGSDSSGTVTASHVYVDGGTATNVYGGNNLGGTTNVTNVYVTAGTITNVYGGGEKASSQTSNLEITGGKISYVFGGGNQAGVTTTNVKTNGGTIGSAFGGSNTSGDVETSNVSINDSNLVPNNGIAVTKVITEDLSDNTWRDSATTYPTYAKIKVEITNNSDEAITKWNGEVNIPNSKLYANYSWTAVTEDNGKYTFNEVNQYYGTNTISAHGTYSFEFEVILTVSKDEFSATGKTVALNEDGSEIEIIGTVQTVYGGNNLGGTTKTANVSIAGKGTQTVYGGGNQAVTNVTNVNITGEVEKFVYGGGNQAGVNTDTNVTLEGATVGDNLYGGGNEGTVSGNTNVNIKNSTFKNSVYSGGNGAEAIVYGNTNMIMQGTNEVTNNVFGGGNQAATGSEKSNNSKSTVNIVGGKIGGNVYGAANTSVVYGTVELNLGYDAVNDSSLEKGDVEITGTVFGGGEANASGSEVYDFSFISVTNGIVINIDANGHNKFAITGSIFGSGNASSTSGTSYINISNYGTTDSPQSNVSLQRADCATISNSAITLSGATDRTNEYSAVFFAISRVDQIKLKNNSTLYLCNGANLLKKLDSLVDVNGVEETGTVTIDTETGDITNRNVDNRIYMLEGKNLNVATNEQATAYGQVHGMFFLGLFTNRKNPATSTGFYYKGYNNGDEITNAGTFISNSYVMAQHMTDHDITIDGFYTNNNEDGKIKVDYVDTTPKDDVYYIWMVGEELDVTVFNVDLVASKYATLGTYELLLKGFSNPNLKLTLVGFSSGLSDGIQLVDPNEIETIEQDEERANSVFGLTMKTGNTGWQTKGSTKFLTDNGGSYIGTNDYDKDNSSYTPTLNLCFYHSENVSKKQALGDARIRLQVLTQIDDLNYSISYIDIEVTLSVALYQNDFFEAAITPGQEYELFTTTETTITNKSAFSTYYSLYIEDFSNSKYIDEYSTYQRVLDSRDANNEGYAFPAKTKITMIDMVTNKYYYYIVTEEDVASGKHIYNLSDFIEMGSSDSHFDEEAASKTYYDEKLDLIYENYIFHVNFVDTDLNENIENNSLLMEMRDNDGETLLGVLGIQRDTMIYSVYSEKSATIKLDGELSPETLYLGKTMNVDVTTDFTQVIVDSKTVYDTQFFDQKLGIKLTIYDNNGNKLNLDSLFGVNFELDGQLYYPRIDGTTRICIADKVTNVLARLKMNTSGNTTLASGDYTIQIESFASPDGIYYGLTASDSIKLNFKIINSSYGLKVTNQDESKILNKDTGKNENGTNTVTCTVEYSSKFTTPNIKVALYRRDYTSEFAQTYTLVDMQDYVTDTLTKTNVDKEYLMSDSPSEKTINTYTFKENLMTGTYKIVYKLYDQDTYIGEAYDYIVIK